MNYTEVFGEIETHCRLGRPEDIDRVMKILDSADLPVTRAVDFYLGFVDSSSGLKQLEHYLFSGSLIQRNYCTLFFARRNDWDLVNRAYREGLIDRIQAYSR